MYKPIAERKREPDNIWCSKVNKSINQTQAIKTDHVATIQHDFFFFPIIHQPQKKKKKISLSQQWRLIGLHQYIFVVSSFIFSLFFFPSLSKNLCSLWVLSFFTLTKPHTLFFCYFEAHNRPLTRVWSDPIQSLSHHSTNCFFFSPTVAVRFSFSVDPLRSFSLSLSDTMWIFFEPRFSSKNVSSFPDITEWFGL